MLSFLIPTIEGRTKTDAVYEAVVRFNGLVDPDRFFSIGYTQNGQEQVVTVGQLHSANGEPVLMILKERRDGAPFLVCTANRGFVRGDPILVDGGSRTTATRFTSDDKQSHIGRSGSC